jgi:glycosyltransferase involved in cell wall biosynthesis
MNVPLVSVVMGVRNAEAYIAAALDSITQQDVAAIEVIVVDDGSSDATAAIAKRHRASPQVITQAPSGVSAGLNRGIAAAQGRYLAFLDGDDIWPAGRLTAMLEAIERDDTIDCVFGGVINTDADLNPIASSRPARLVGALLIKREAALRLGGFDGGVAHAAIVDWSSRAEAAGLKFHALDRPVLLRRIHGDNFGIRDRTHARVDLLRVIRDHHNRTRR